MVGESYETAIKCSIRALHLSAIHPNNKSSCNKKEINIAPSYSEIVSQTKEKVKDDKCRPSTF